MSDASGQTAWSYDVLGNVLTGQRSIGGVTKALSYGYETDGRLLTVNYPSGLQIQYTNLTTGQQREIKCVTLNWANPSQNPCPSSPAQISYLASNVTFTASGALTGVLLGSGYTWTGSNYVFSGGVTITNTYNQRLQPNHFQATYSNGTVSVLDLTYNFVQNNVTNVNNGSVAAITNNLNAGRSQSYGYDQLNRLNAAQSAATSGADNPVRGTCEEIHCRKFGVRIRLAGRPCRLNRREYINESTASN